MTKLTAENVYRNDSGKSIDEVNEMLKDSVTMDYKGLRIRVPKQILENAKSFLIGEMVKEYRTGLVESLDYARPLLDDPNHKSKVSDDFVGDLVLLTALDELDAS
jgi:hypothetical protein